MNWGDGELVFTPLPIALRISGLRISHSLEERSWNDCLYGTIADRASEPLGFAPLVKFI